MSTNKLRITPATTVHELLNAYPDLVEDLIALAPPFKKLRNPALRKSVAKVATLKHVAAVGNIPLNELIHNVQAAVGQPIASESYTEQEYITPQPDWFSPDKVGVSLVEGEVGDPDKMTLVAVLQAAKEVKIGEMIELVTTFLPAPGIDTMRAKGYSVWTTQCDDETVRTYFLKNKM
jgi:hypothetical protein